MLDPFSTNRKAAVFLFFVSNFNSFDKNYQSLGDNSLLMDATKIHTARYEIAANSFQSLSKSNPTQATWYDFAGLGICNHIMISELMIMNDSTRQIHWHRDRYSENRLVIVMGFGVKVMFSNQYGLDFFGTVDMVPFTTGKYSPEGKGVNFPQIFDLKVSAVAMF